MRHIIWEEYNHLFPHNELLIGHIYHECPILTKDCGYSEERSRYGYNDYGYAFGLMQHNIHHRSAKWMKENDLYYRPSNPAYTTELRNKFEQDHEWAQTWQGQWKQYLLIQTGCIEKYNSVNHCIRLWNWNAGQAYLNKVHRDSETVRSMLQ